MKRIRKYPYLFLLSISFLVVGAAWKCGLIDLDQQTDVFSQQHTVHTDVKDAEMHPMDPPSEEAEVLEPEDTGLKPEVPLPPMEGSEEKEPVFILLTGHILIIHFLSGIPGLSDYMNTEILEMRLWWLTPA